MGDTVFGVATVGFVFMSLSSVHFPLTREMFQFRSCPGHCGCDAARSFFNFPWVFHLRSAGANPGCAKLCVSAFKLSSTSCKLLLTLKVVLPPRPCRLVSFCVGSTFNVDTLLRTSLSVCVASPICRIVSSANDTAAGAGIPWTSSPCSSPNTKLWLMPPHWKSKLVRPRRCCSVSTALSRSVMSADPADPCCAVSAPTRLLPWTPRGTSVDLPVPSTTVTFASPTTTFGACRSPGPS
mmetsp:Transcript_11167/g.27970  ORF Transcript_11167/g.27970 Transcript_11167/m.27970 type:complete len:238 (+) Transcript_11167:765-1478(+)